MPGELPYPPDRQIHPRSDVYHVRIGGGARGGRQSCGTSSFSCYSTMMAFYVATWPLKINEVREGGYAWNVLRAFALSWPLFVVAVGLAAISGIGNTASAVFCS